VWSVVVHAVHGLLD